MHHNTHYRNVVETFFFLLGFTPCKGEQPLQSMELQEKETQKIKAHRKSV